MAEKSLNRLLPKNIKPVHYDIAIQTDLVNFTFKGLTNISLKVEEATKQIIFNTKELKVEEPKIIVKNENKDYKVTNINYDTELQRCILELDNELEKGKELELNLTFYGILNNSMTGFYRSSFIDNEGNESFMASTHFEPSDARQAFPCWDEPAIRATFSIKLTVASNYTALSNTSIESEKEIDIKGESYKQITFKKTPSMSTYLIAFAVGEFDYIEDKTKLQSIKTRVYAVNGSAHLGKFALQVAIDSMDLFYEKFGIPYPIDKLDLIAIPDFNIGAMENWGLVTFRTVCLLYDEKSSSFKNRKNIANIVAHELAHQWFGNLVALEWWSQLWLKEGFATWIASYATETLFPSWKSWTLFVQDDYQRALKLDGLESSHPIEVPVNDPSEIGQIFDAISYSKGASVIRMLYSYLGDEQFFNGIRIYLEKHQYSNATTQDLWNSLSEASGKDISEFMNHWTKSTGYPIITIEEEGDNLKIKQTRYFSNKELNKSTHDVSWWVPLLWHRNDSNNLPSIISNSEITVPKPTGPFYKINSDSVGLYRVSYPESNFKALCHEIQFGNSLSDNDKIGLLSDYYSLAISGHRKTSDFLNLAYKFKDEKSSLVLQEVSSRLALLGSIFFEAPDSFKDNLNKLRSEIFNASAERLGFDAKKDEDNLDSILRATAIRNMTIAKNDWYITEGLKRFHLWNDGIEGAVHKDLRAFILQLAVKEGNERDYEDVKSIYQKAETMDLKILALIALGATTNSELIQNSLNYSLSSEVKPQDTLTLLSSLASNHKARRSTWSFIQTHWGIFESRYKNNVSTLGNVLKATVGLFASEKDLEDLKNFFKGKNTISIDRALNNCIEEIKSNASWYSRSYKEVEDWLNENTK